MSSEPTAPAHPLAAIFDPQSIAVVGASADPTKRGHQILRALGASGYRGVIHPVNPREGTILGHRVFPSIRALPQPVDLAVLCTPAAAAPSLVEECGARGVRAAVVLAVGFAESGPEGAELERRLVEAARTHDVRLVGPNTSGILNTHAGANLIGARDVRPGGLALLVQSGNMALALMNEASDRTWDGVSICVGLGNAADVGFSEALHFLGQHAETRGVIVYAEGLDDARAFLATAAAVTREKPVVMIKAGRSEHGARTALSHTGAVAGPYDRFKAGLAQAGVVEIQRTDEVLHVAQTLASQPAVAPGAGVAILSDGGGQGTLAVDALTDLGAPMPVLSDDVTRRLRTLLGPAAAVTNPVDLAGAADVDPGVFGRALEILSGEESLGAVLVVGLFGGYGIRFSEKLTEAEVAAAREMAAQMGASRKGLVVHSMYATTRSAPLEALGLAGVPVVESLDVACRCIAELVRSGARTTRAPWRPEAEIRSLEQASSPGPTIEATRAGHGALTEPEARILLAEHGLDFGPWRAVDSADAAASALVELGAPAVLKVVSRSIVHKSDAGGVVLGIREPHEARDAYVEVTRRAVEWQESRGATAEVVGALLSPMAPTPLVELLVGAYRDPGLGPVLTIGAGGTWVEVLEDVANRVLPIGPDEVLEMLDELRVGALLKGGRGRPAAAPGPIVEAVRAVATCVERHPEIAELEVNPLFVYPDRVEPLDARVILFDRAGDDQPR